MRNLAGSHHPDDYIRNELERARIPVVQTEAHSGEVAYSLIGKLDDLTFTRAWTYWVVNGLVPIEVAETLYDNPVGKTDIRVDGHAGCPPPTGRFINSYHIDTEVGLRIFVDALRAHMLVDSNI